MNSNLTDSVKVALANEIDQLKVTPIQKYIERMSFNDKSATTIPNNLLDYTDKVEEKK